MSDEAKTAGRYRLRASSSVGRRWYGVTIAGAAAVACGLLMGTPAEWLVLAVGLFALVGAPGVVIVRQARGD